MEFIHQNQKSLPIVGTSSPNANPPSIHFNDPASRLFSRMFLFLFSHTPTTNNDFPNVNPPFFVQNFPKRISRDGKHCASKNVHHKINLLPFPRKQKQSLNHSIVLLHFLISTFAKPFKPKINRFPNVASLWNGTTNCH